MKYLCYNEFSKELYCGSWRYDVYCKEKYLNKRNIFDIIFVPYASQKADFVNPYNSILIDDDIYNLEEWEQRGGIPILFNQHMKNIDSYGNKNVNFIIINNLLKIYDIIDNK